MKFSFKPSPNYRDSKSTTEIMLDLTLCLCAVLVFAAVYYASAYGIAYGVRVILMALIAVVTAMATEAVFYKVTGSKDIKHDVLRSYGWVTALIMVLISKISVSYYAMIISVIVAIVFGKLVFGGFGQNIFNPAAFGEAIIMNSFAASTSADFVTGATPLTTIKSSGWAASSDVLSGVVSKFGGFGSFLLGGYASVIGSTCAIVIILCFLFLAWQKDIDWKIPLVYLVSVFVMSLIVGLIKGSGFTFALINLLCGGVLFCGVFMLTDPVTNPVSIPGRVVFAFCAACLTLIIRWKSNLPDGALYSILLMNMLTPAIDKAFDGSQIKDEKKIAKRVYIICAIVAVITLAIGGTMTNSSDSAAVANEETVVCVEEGGQL